MTYQIPAYNDFELFCGPVHVGRIQEAFYTNHTWYGSFEATATPDQSALAARVRQFIQFSIDWNEREQAGEDQDAEEWSSFPDVIAPGLWQIRGPEGIMPVEEPVFFLGGDVTWAGPPPADY